MEKNFDGGRGRRDVHTNGEDSPAEKKEKKGAKKGTGEKKSEKAAEKGWGKK